MRENRFGILLLGIDWHRHSLVDPAGFPIKDDRHFSGHRGTRDRGTIFQRCTQLGHIPKDAGIGVSGMVDHSPMKLLPTATTFAHLEVAN